MTLDRLKKEIREFVEHLVGQRQKYLAPYKAQVVSYDAAKGLVELVVDDDRFKGTGAKDVENLTGLPGSIVELREGDRVILMFDGGNPDKPFCVLAEQAIGASTLAKLSRIGDLIDGGTVTGSVAAAPGAVTFVYAPPGAPPHAPGPTLDLSNALLKGPEILTGSDRAELED